MLLLFLLIIAGQVALACQSHSAENTPVRFMVFGDSAEYAAYQALVQAYEEAFPGRKIDLMHIPSANQYRSRLLSDFLAGTPPDVSLLNYRRFGFLADSGWLEPLAEYLKKSDQVSEKDFYPITWEVFQWKGVQYCIPQNISSLVVYYNVDLFKQAGVPLPADDWTWDSFLSTAKALTRDLDGDGVIDQYGLGVEPTLYRLAPFIWQNNAPLVDNPQNPTRLTLTRPPALEAFRWFTDLQHVHGVIPDRVAESALDSETRFISGLTAMYLNSRRGTPTYREIESFTWDIAPLPAGKTRAGVLHSDGYCISAASTQKQAAWDFVAFANSARGQKIVAASGRIVPSRMDVAQSEAFLAPGLPPAHAQVFLSEIPNLQSVPLITTWDEIEKVASEEIARAFYGEIPVDEAASLAVQRTEEYFLLGKVNQP